MNKMVYTGILTANEILKYQNKENLSISMYSMPQLKVPEAPYSKMSPHYKSKEFVSKQKLPAYN